MNPVTPPASAKALFRNRTPMAFMTTRDDQPKRVEHWRTGVFGGILALAWFTTANAQYSPYAPPTYGSQFQTQPTANQPTTGQAIAGQPASNQTGTQTASAAQTPNAAATQYQGQTPAASPYPGPQYAVPPSNASTQPPSEASPFQTSQYQAGAQSPNYQAANYQSQRQNQAQQYLSSPAPQPTTSNRAFAAQPPTEVTFPPTRFGPRGQRTAVPGPTTIGSGNAFPPIGTDPVFTTPNVRVADLIVNGFPARTGRIMFGGAVNSDAGVTGQITIDERNFDISRWPRSFRDLFSGTAFRGAGQTFRVEAAPGSDFDRYSMQFADPNLFGYLPISFSVSGFLYDRRFRDWDENRLGGRIALGYRITPDLSVSAGISGQRVRIDNVRIPIAELSDGPGGIGDGDNGIYSASLGLTHNTRDSPIQPSEGHFMQLTFEQTFGDFDYPRLEFEYRKYWLLASRADGSGKQTISYSTQLGISGNETPIYEHFFAGGYATLRGFDFRGAGPVISGVEAGGEFQWLNSIEYMFPITADDAFRGVLFTDFGTVEEQVELESDTFRVAPGFGLRVAIPALGPAPLAFDFAYPINDAPTDDRRSLVST